MADTNELTGLRALVTGASSGIGAAIARELAACGVHLVLSARRRPELDALATECRAAGVRTDVVVADLGAHGAVAALWTAARAGGDVDILINSAGFGYFRRFGDAEAARDAELIQLNISALVELTHALVAERRAGSARAYILNIASTAAFQAVPRFAVYAASKAFVRNFSEALHDELARTSTSVTCLCPGGTVTAFHAAAGAGNYGALANLSMMSAESVARTAVRGLRRRRRTVVPGVLNKLAVAFVRLVPARVAAFAASWVLGTPRAEALPPRTLGGGDQ